MFGRKLNRFTILSMTILGAGTAMLPVLAGLALADGHHDDTQLELQVLGSYRTGIFVDGGSEIPAHDSGSQRLFVTNGAEGKIDIIDAHDPAAPVLIRQVDLSAYGKAPTSVAVHQGLVASSVVNVDKQQNGKVVFMDIDGKVINQLEVGALPDMLTFSPDGGYLLVANEGEPNDDYTIDPEGSVSIIDLRCKNDRGRRHHSKGLNNCVARLDQDAVRTAGFTSFNGKPLPAGIRVFGPNATVARDFEPEYITIDEQSRTAWVTLQENNAVAVIDIRNAKVEKLISLGFKDHSMPGNELDASNKDGGINFTNPPVFGMYQPDSIASYQYRGQTFIVTANEGDSRDYAGFSEEERIKDLTLDPVAFPDAASLQDQANLGRLKVTSTLGDYDNDGDYDALFSYGARSFSIRTAHGKLVFDSGADIERITSILLPADFNSDNEANSSLDDRSDDKGPEPEGLAIGKVGNRTICFIGLERVGGVMVYDITDPYRPEFVQYINNRDFLGDPAADTAGDLGPEGLMFIGAAASPINKPLLVVANEISGSTTIYEIHR